MTVIKGCDHENQKLDFVPQVHVEGLSDLTAAVDKLNRTMLAIYELLRYRQ